MREIVLFLHSIGTTPALWTGVPPEAIGHRDAVRPANLFYPPYAPLEKGKPFTIDDECAHIISTIGDKPDRIHIVAHSYGATVALRLAEWPQFRERLGSMVLFEPVLFGSLTKDHTGEIAAAEPATVLSAREFAASPVILDEEKGGTAEWIEVFIDYWNRPGAWLRMPDAMKQASLAIGWKMFREVQICFNADKPFRDYAVPVPTTLVMGARTTAHSRAMTTHLARAHGLRVIEIGVASHTAPLTHPALAHAAIGEHFAVLPRPE